MAKKKAKRPAPVEFDHRRVQSEHEASGSVIFHEARGVRDASTVFLFSEFEDTLLQGNHQGYTALETYSSFFEAAGHWLKDAGEKTFFEVAKDAEEAQVKANAKTQVQKKRIDRFVFQKWAFEVGMRHGFLSPAAIAADFLAASDYVHRLVGGNQDVMRAVYQFAEAWHWFQFEGKGEHELAAMGRKSLEGRARGPAAKQERGNLKKAIVKDAYEQFAADEKNGSARKNAKKAAGALLQAVNKKLSDLGVRTMADKSLIDELRPLVKEKFPKV